MKKLMVFIFISLLGVTMFLPRGDIFDMKNILSCTLVMDVGQAQEEGLSFVTNGSDAIVEFEDLKKAEECFKDLNPKCVILKFNEKEGENIKKFLKIDSFSTQTIENMQILCAYTSLYPEFKMVENKRINVQIVEKEGCLLCGFPMVMTGF